MRDDNVITIASKWRRCTRCGYVWAGGMMVCLGPPIREGNGPSWFRGDCDGDTRPLTDVEVATVAFDHTCEAVLSLPIDPEAQK